MKIGYCQSCARNTGFKRALGLGTVLMLVLTGGTWLFALPFYPSRCVICGCRYGHWKRVAFACLAFVGVLWLCALLRTWQ